MSKTGSPQLPSKEIDGLAFACLLDGSGSGKIIGWDAINSWSPGEQPLWVHLDHAAPAVSEWLKEQADIPEVACRALLEEETRPRVFTVGSGLVAILRGVNLNAGQDPEDMVAIRLWVDANRVISLRHQRLMTARDVLAQIVEQKTGPTTAPDIFVRAVERLTERMNSVIVQLDEQLDGLDGRLEEDDSGNLRRELTGLRQTCVALRRYIGPQREALSRLQIEHPAWLNQHQRNHIRESADKLQRYVEDLDAARDRAVVLRDEIANRLSVQMNRTLYALSIVAGVFLPLGFLTGLLGINVGGMPGVEYDYAFWIACLLMVLVFIGEVALFRRLKWI